jgi:site-specific DNA-cytosine methylase
LLIETRLSFVFVFCGTDILPNLEAKKTSLFLFTITTQFSSYGSGRFGHPDQDRAISIREGALLQTFPEDYDFGEEIKTVVITK